MLKTKPKPMDNNELYDHIKRIPRCEHRFGTHRQEAMGPDGKTRVIAGTCEKCGCTFPVGWVEVQNLSPYALYLIALAVKPIIEQTVRDVLVGHIMGDDEG